MKKILIIEDDAVVAYVYRTSLEKRGYQIETCHDGASGLTRIQEFRPDAVLLDLMLPKMNGIEFLKQLRTQKEFAALPVIVLTNAYIPNMIQEAFAARASQVFNKATITPQHILDSLDQLLNGGIVIKPVEAMPTPPPPPKEHPGSPPPPSNYGYNDTYSSQPRPGPRDKTDESVFQSDVRKAFLDAHSGTVVLLRKLVQGVIKSSEQARQPLLEELYRKIHGLTGSAGIVGFIDIAQIAAVFEVLLKELIEQPKTANESTLRTMTSSVDLIGELFKNSSNRSRDHQVVKLLIVDDECLSRRAIAYALKKAHLDFVAEDVEDPDVALRKANEKTFDLIFLDIQMPSMNGFDLCSKIRAGVSNASTPIIFVTSLADFKSRAKSTLCGGSELIAKPFLFVELALKVIALLIRNRTRLQSKAA